MNTNKNTTPPIDVNARINWEKEERTYKEMTRQMAKPELSVVIPVYNEEDNIELLYEKLLLALTACGRTWEVIFIDDGSTDASFEELQKLVNLDHRAKVVKFVKNFGQTAALAAGIDHARGQVIIPMDADLQNDPEDIQRLLDKMDEGYDVVSGWRKDRKDAFASR
ncbi:MAG TPA: glycosyltransferase family 2 protein, partial [Candidatus Melainabacteria bacterium]|nr:glycosyltransferase family 2 protein [Candidatus Melainabacteria bacterium]